jgi:hypothetical protein
MCTIDKVQKNSYYETRSIKRFFWHLEAKKYLTLVEIIKLLKKIKFIENLDRKKKYPRIK